MQNSSLIYAQLLTVEQRVASLKRIAWWKKKATGVERASEWWKVAVDSAEMERHGSSVGCGGRDVYHVRGV